MNAKNFVDRLYKVYDDNKGVILEENKELFLELNVPKKMAQSKSNCVSFFDCLYKNYNLDGVQYFGIFFKSSYQDSEELLWFGVYDGVHDLVLNKISGEIEIIDEKGELIFAVAPSLKSFLELIVLLSEYNVKSFTKNNLYTDDDVKSILEKAKVLLGDEYFFPFLNHIFPASESR